MATKSFNYTTGPSTMPDVGILSYNGCVFSPLFLSEVSGKCIKDDATRTVKFMEYTITVDGYATHPAANLEASLEDSGSMSPTMLTLRSLLTAQGGALSYKGRGNDIVVNMPGGTKDAAWGPVPQIIEFQPLGGGLSAKIKWSVTVHVIEPQPVPKVVAATTVKVFDDDSITPGPAKAFQAKPGPLALPPNFRVPRILQFNYESAVSYGEDGYSTITNRGVLEIPLTRDPTQDTRTFAQTADFLRGEIERRIMSGIDLKQYRITRRTFTVSRDKRVLTWDFSAEEKGYMDLPLGCMTARGTYSVKPSKSGMGLATWMCTLRATYTVRADQPRRLAWLGFLALLRHRMSYSVTGTITNPSPKVRPPAPPVVKEPSLPERVANDISGYFKSFFKKQEKSAAVDPRRAWLMDFSFEEGIYLDSKTTSFSATWKLMTNFSHILLASGLWTKVEGDDRTLWATTIKNVSGAQSWLPNMARTDIVVDFGGG